jgi:hypothetical protein
MRNVLSLLFFLGLSVSNANAVTVFYDNLTLFDSVSTTTVTDFDSEVTDGQFKPASSFTIDGNTYSNLSGEDMAICGADAGCDGGPYDSAIMIANSLDGTVRIDLVGSISAIGGLFGDIDGPVGTGTLRVFNSDGLFDTQDVSYGSMGYGLDKTFFGWTTTDTFFTALEFSIEDSGNYSAVDNIQFGSVVPIPAAVWLFGTALIGFVGYSRRRKVA